VVEHEIVTGCVDGRVRIYDLRMGMVYSDLIGSAITSVRQTRDGNAVLVSTLDSTLRLMDKGNGQLLQSYQGHRNQDYRIRSALGLNDAVAVSGSEDGYLYAWDVLRGTVMEKLSAHNGKVASAVTFNGTKKEWASAGTDGKFFFSRHHRNILTFHQVPWWSGVCEHENVNPGSLDASELLV
jgi:mitogen-activated protein kinase organizer 1